MQRRNLQKTHAPCPHIHTHTHTHTHTRMRTFTHNHIHPTFTNRIGQHSGLGRASVGVDSNISKNKVDGREGIQDVDVYTSGSSRTLSIFLFAGEGRRERGLTEIS